jgi:hypothetical protein
VRIAGFSIRVTRGAYLLGLSAILGFIGVKLITEALLESGVHRIGPVPVPHIGTGLSLAIIAAVITTVTLTSLLAAGRRTRPENLDLPDGERQITHAARLRRGLATGAYSLRGAAGPGETAIRGRPDLMCG